MTLSDLSAAFATIVHSILLSRLRHSFGISSVMVFSWYHAVETQIISVNGFKFLSQLIQYVLPQGSVLDSVFSALCLALPFSSSPSFTFASQFLRPQSGEQIPSSLSAPRHLCKITALISEAQQATPQCCTIEMIFVTPKHT